MPTTNGTVATGTWSAVAGAAMAGTPIAVNVTLPTAVVGLEATCKNEAGTAIDISTATEKTFRVRSAEGVIYDIAGTFTTDGSDGKVKCSLPSAAVVKSCTLQWELHVVMGGTTRKTAIQTQVIAAHLPPPT